MLFHEAPHKLRGTLDDLCAVFGPERKIALCRELTKLHEETVRCTVGEAAAYYRENDPRGEYVLVLAGAEPKAETEITLDEGVGQVLALKARGARMKEAVRQVSDTTGLSRNDLYNAAVASETEKT
jgi:16S rRNA (cytidine1402-2'-O)-methyltransferase